MHHHEHTCKGTCWPCGNTHLHPEILTPPSEHAPGAQILGDHEYVDESASVRLPESSSHFQARLQSSVLPGGRDQLQAVLCMPEAPKQSLDDRPFAGSDSGGSSSSGSPAMLTKVGDANLAGSRGLGPGLLCGGTKGAGRGATGRAWMSGRLLRSVLYPLLQQPASWS